MEENINLDNIKYSSEITSKDIKSILDVSGAIRGYTNEICLDKFLDDIHNHISKNDLCKAKAIIFICNTNPNTSILLMEVVLNELMNNCDSDCAVHFDVVTIDDMEKDTINVRRTAKMSR